MKLLTCIAALAMLAFAAPAAAQSAWGTLRDGFWGPTFSGSRGVSSDWDRCTNSNRVYDVQISIDSCTNLIAANDARSWFGPLYWYRGLRYLAAGNREQYRNDLAQAEEYFSIEIRANPREYWGYNNRAGVQTRLGHFDNALVDYERAATLSRDAIAPHMGMAGVYFRQREFRAALEALDSAGRTAARTGQSWPSLHAARCDVRAALQIELDRALRFCNRAVRNADTPSYALTSRGYFHFMAATSRRPPPISPAPLKKMRTMPPHCMRAALSPCAKATWRKARRIWLAHAKWMNLESSTTQTPV